MTDPADISGAPPQPADGPDARRKLIARRRTEHLKLAAGALDRLSTVVLGAAVLAPVIQHKLADWWETAGWVLTAVVLHLIAQYLLSLMQEEI